MNVANLPRRSFLASAGAAVITLALPIPKPLLPFGSLVNADVVGSTCIPHGKDGQVLRRVGTSIEFVDLTDEELRFMYG